MGSNKPNPANLKFKVKFRDQPIIISFDIKNNPQNHITFSKAHNKFPFWEFVEYKTNSLIGVV
jgi:hypothetical protein